MAKIKNLSEAGQIIIISLMFMTITVALIGGLIVYTLTQVKSHRQAVSREKGISIAEAGVEAAIWKLNNQAGYTGETNTSYDVGNYTVTLTTLSGSSKLIKVEAFVPSTNTHRIVQVTATIGTKNIGFNYGVQVGAGGLDMDNNSVVSGNIYADGDIVGGNSGSTITGDAIVAGSTGTIDSVVINGNSTSHNITNSTVAGNANHYHLANTDVTGNVSVDNMSSCHITGNATYNTKSSCTISGTSTTPNTSVPSDPAFVPLPIDSTEISDWESQATNGGVIASQTINGNVSLGPIKINGNLTVNGTLTVTGTIWVTGQITLTNGSIIQLSSSFGSLSGVILAGTSGSTTNGYINMNNGVTINGSGTAGSYIMLLSERDTTSSSALAITAANNSNSAIVYAKDGTIEVSNNAQLKEITGWKIHMNNNAVVTYDSGLASAAFSSGPAAGWQVADQTWQLLQ